MRQALIGGAVRTVVQRVKEASVVVAGQCVGKIEQGLLALLGVHIDDTPEHVEWMCNKLLNLRIFSDSDEKMNRSVLDVAGGVLLISQFTLYGDCRKGRRPAFVDAAPPEKAIPLYESVCQILSQALDDRLQTGKFGAKMAVSLVNDGPVTLVIESPKRF